MTERITVPAAAAFFLPLLAAALLAPAGLDQALDPLLAGGLPLAWAALWSILFKTDHSRMGAASIAALPFSVYALASFSARPFAAHLAVLGACAAAMVAVTALSSRKGTHLSRALASAAAAMPGLVIAAFAGPWPGAAVSTLLAASALYLRLRRPR